MSPMPPVPYGRFGSWYGVQYLDDGPLADFVLQRGNAERPLPPVRLRDVRPPNRARSERAPRDAGGEVLEVALQRLPVVRHVSPSTTAAASRFRAKYAAPQTVDVVDVVRQRG
jgi:hypothetical protein